MTAVHGVADAFQGHSVTPLRARHKPQVTKMDLAALCATETLLLSSLLLQRLARRWRAR